MGSIGDRMGADEWRDRGLLTKPREAADDAREYRLSRGVVDRSADAAWSVMRLLAMAKTPRSHHRVG